MRSDLRVGEGLAAGAVGFRANAGPLIGGGLLASLVSGLTFGLGMAPMLYGYYLLALRAVRGEDVRARDVMEGWSWFASAVGAMLFGGLVALPLFLPYVLAALQKAGGHQTVLTAHLGELEFLGRYAAGVAGMLATWVFLLRVDGEEGFVSAVSLVLGALFRHLPRVLLYAWVYLCVYISGVFLLVVGLLASAPISVGMMVHGYDQLFANRERRWR
jgi:hypothetical protein